MSQELAVQEELHARGLTMNIRDQFAAAALPGAIAKHGLTSKAVNFAFSVADMCVQQSREHREPFAGEPKRFG